MKKYWVKAGVYEASTAMALERIAKDIGIRYGTPNERSKGADVDVRTGVDESVPPPVRYATIFYRMPHDTPQPVARLVIAPGRDQRSVRSFEAHVPITDRTAAVRLERILNEMRFRKVS